MADEQPFVTGESPLTRHIAEMLVLPILKALYFDDGSVVHKLVGTGFFIDSLRILTARHVLIGRSSATDLEGATGFAVYCVHSVDRTRRPVARHVDVSSIITRNDSDIATALVELNQFGRPNPAITEKEMQQTGYMTKMSVEPVSIGTRIYTIAYPLATVISKEGGNVDIHAQSDVFEGRITAHYPAGRDRGLLSWPCYETDMEIKGGASGGPVLVSGSKGVVFGVNCTGTEPHSVSHVTSLAPLVKRGFGTA